MTKAASARRLTGISGFDQFPDADFSAADDTLVQDFDDLATALRHIATELCQSSVTITKLLDEKGDGQLYSPADGWTFTANVSTDPRSYTWVQPAPPPDRGERRQTTNDAGVVTFQSQRAGSPRRAPTEHASCAASGATPARPRSFPRAGRRPASPAATRPWPSTAQTSSSRSPRAAPSRARTATP